MFRDFDPNSSDFTLEAVITMEIQNYAKEINEVSNNASMELAVEMVCTVFYCIEAFCFLLHWKIIHNIFISLLYIHRAWRQLLKFGKICLLSWFHTDKEYTDSRIWMMYCKLWKTTRCNWEQWSQKSNLKTLLKLYKSIMLKFIVKCN